MEHYRRLGFADEVRRMGIPSDYPTDVAYFTDFSGFELARFEQPSPAQAFAVARGRQYLGSWYTPELPHRGSQLFLEPILRKHAEMLPSVDVRFGCRFRTLEQNAEAAVASIEELNTGKEFTIEAAYVVGCDGPRSSVRKTLNIGYVGQGGADRAFMGGRMYALYFRAPTFYDRISHKRAWQYWSLLPDRRAVMVAIDGRETFAGSIQLQANADISAGQALKTFQRAFGVDIPAEIISTSYWTAGFSLVAEHFNIGRVFLAGDAAHLFTPTGGMGYNTGIDDAANLGWKLAALCRGWGGPKLPESYDVERRAIAARNTDFARRIADSIGHMKVSEQITAVDESGRLARQELGAALQRHARMEFDIPGVQLGLRYENSIIIEDDSFESPPDLPNTYVPSARPGHRAPHYWLADGRCLFDMLGRGFTLLRLGHHPPEGYMFAAAAAAFDVPLSILEVKEPRVRELYQADLVLIRPDQHVAWRGDEPPNDVRRIIKRCAGWE